MKMYSKLVKVFFKEGFSFKRIIGSGNYKSKGKVILLAFLLLYGVGAIFFVFGKLFYELGDVFNQLGMIEALLLYLFMYATFLSIIFILFRANGYLFNYKDYQILVPLPIPSRIVTYAKATVMMVLIWASLLLFTAPMAFSYFYYTGFDFIGILVYIVGIIVLPLVPTILFSFLVLLVTRFTGRFKRSSIFTTILTFIIMLGVLYLSFSINTVSGTNPLLNQQEFITKASKYYINMKWFMNAVSDHSLIDILLLIFVNSGLFFLFLTVIQKIVLKTNQKGIVHKTSSHKKPVVSKKSTVFRSILTKEFSKLFNTSIYALNSGFGVILMLLGGIAAIVFSDKVQNFMQNLVGIPIAPELLLLILIAFCLSTVFTSAISLSLEGKNFWIIKSLPIKAETVVFSKMFFNILLALPIAILSTVLIAIAIKSTFVSILVIILYITTLSFVSSALGSIINLLFPKFDFVDPIEVVKQSAGAVLGLFGTMIIAVINGLLVYLLYDLMSWEITIILSSLLNAIIFGLLALIIYRKSESLFIKMQA